MSYYDPTDYSSSGYTGYSYSNDLSYASSDAYTTSLGYSSAGDQAWYAGDTQLASEYYQESYTYNSYSNELDTASWDAYNSSSYADAGYSTTDTSYIEPAYDAGSSSVISDYDSSSTL